MNIKYYHTDELIAELKSRTGDCVFVSITREDLEEYAQVGKSDTPAFVSPLAWSKDVRKAFNRWEDDNSNDLFVALLKSWENSKHKNDPFLNS